MAIKIGQAEYSIHEIILLIFSLCFFAMLFIGAFEFGWMGRIFPLGVGGAGLFLTLLYLISGFLPPGFNEVMSRDTEFQLFGLIPEQGQEAEVSQKQSSEDWTFKIEKSYFVIALFALFIIISWLFGFYISTFIISVTYLSLYGKASRYPLRSIIYKILLVIILIGGVYIFDLSFGHDFMEGKVFEYYEILDQ